MPFITITHTTKTSIPLKSTKTIIILTNLIIRMCVRIRILLAVYSTTLLTLQFPNRFIHTVHLSNLLLYLFSRITDNTGISHLNWLHYLQLALARTQMSLHHRFSRF
jgi:hypothetical protein